MSAATTEAVAPASGMALRIRSLTKSFGSVPVLKGVDLEVGEGEIHGLLGANGAGKSTLVKVLCGYYEPGEGSELEVWGTGLQRGSTVQAGNAALLAVHQDLGLVGNLSLLENFAVSDRFGSTGGAPIRWGELAKRAGDLLSDFGLPKVDLDAPAERCEPAVRASVAIARTLDAAQRAGIERVLLLLDEPTVYFNPHQRERLFGTMRRMANNGHSVLLISHRLSEVMAVCERVSVLRSGRVVVTRQVSDVTPQRIVADILGYELGAIVNQQGAVDDKTSVLRFANVESERLHDASFTLARGEVLGITGALGAGQDDIPAIIQGAGGHRLPRTAISVDSVDMGGQLSPSRALQLGIVVVPANRQRDGLWLDGTVGDNLAMGGLNDLSHRGYINRRTEKKQAAATLRRWNVRPAQPDVSMRTLSGGNQQKVVLARAMAHNPSILVLHEPTQGVDAGGKKEIMEAVLRVAREDGVSILVCSTDYEELAALCSRVLILSDGRVSDELRAPGISEESLEHAVHATELR